MDWRLLTGLVCVYGFLKEFRPSEAYLVAYLTGPWKNLTVEQVDNEIFPVWTYAYLVWLCPVFLLTDLLRYQPMLVLQGLAYISTWSLLIWGRSVLSFKFMDALYGLITATDVAYYSYLFTMVTHEHYHVITSFTRAAVLFGMCASYLTGQLLVSFGLMDYFQLNIVSLVSVSMAFLIAPFLPRPKHSDIFNRDLSNETDGDNSSSPKKNDIEKVKTIITARTDDNEHTLGQKGNTDTKVEEDKVMQTMQKSKRSLGQGIVFLWHELRLVYSSSSVVIWSVWWAFASCGNLQVQNYIQNLWQVVAAADDETNTYNGAVEAAGTLVSALSVLAVSVIPVDWSRAGVSEAAMAAVCVLNCVLLVVMGTNNNIWVAYILYCVFRTTYQTVIAVATFMISFRLQVARSMTRQRYGFVFGVNMFLALVIETVMTVVVVDKVGLGVDVRTQFVIYGGYFGAIGTLFLVVAILSVCRRRRTIAVQR